MSRWSAFRTLQEDIPATPYEAAVFLDNAIRYLWSQKVHGEAIEILLGSHGAVTDAWVVAIAGKGVAA